MYVHIRKKRQKDYKITWACELSMGFAVHGRTPPVKGRRSGERSSTGPDATS